MCQTLQRQHKILAAGHQFNGRAEKDPTKQTQEKEGEKKKRSISQSIWLLIAEAVWMIYSAADGSACQTLKNLRPRESISSALYGQ